MAEIKPFKTVDEQIDILKSRGLIIDDYDIAYKTLSSLNYYRLSAYTLTLRKNDVFYENVHFSDAIQIYNFDMELRALLMYLLESIEISMRTYIGYHHGMKYGALGYLSSNNFDNPERFVSFISDYQKALNEYVDKEAFVIHHKEVYDSKFPIWVLVEMLTFGTLSRLFGNLTFDIQKEICSEHFGPIRPEYISNWMHACTILRNICAHRGRLFNRSIPFSLKLSSKDKKIIQNNNMPVYEANKQLFAYLIVLKKLVPESTIWESFLDRFKAIANRYPFVDLRYYGFPSDWIELLS